MHDGKKFIYESLDGGADDLHEKICILMLISLTNLLLG